MIKGGYRGKILRVNLTTGKITTEKLPEEDVLRKYIGGYGLGLWYLMRELPTGVGALEPENPLIFMNGPLVGTRVPCPTNLTLTTLNADTGFTAGRSHTHGWLGARLDGAGYDGLIITGASDKWVYLLIDSDKVELRDAAKFLDKDTHETEDLIKDELGVTRNVAAAEGMSVAAIGPAGENLCDGAIIENDKNHSFSHSGVGQIMGSKHLKAIAVRGTKEKPVVDDGKLKEIATEWAKKASTVGLFPVLGRAGVPRTDYNSVIDIAGLCVNNWTKGDLPGFGDGMSKHKITPRTCFRCPVACSYDVEVIEGPYKGYVATLSGGGENQEGSSSIVGVGATDPGEIWYLTDLNDRLGFECSSVGCAMAVAFEAYEKGLLTKEDTDGLELKWGDAKVVGTLVRRIAHKEGRFATMLANGPKVAAERVGLPGAAVHIKGTGMSLHDWRRCWGVLLGQIVGGGSGWHGAGVDTWAPEADIGYPEKTDPLGWVDKGKEVALSTWLKMVHDSVGVCWFGTWGIPDVTRHEADALAATVGWDDFTADRIKQVGERITTLERIFNMRQGLTAEDDLKVSPRLLEPAPPDAGPAAGKSIAPYLEGWVRDYYRTLGWDPKTGKPLKSTIKRLGLEEYTSIVWPY